MAGIQGSINSMIGSASHAIMAVRGYQALRAKQAAAAEKAKAKQAQGATPAQPTVADASPQIQTAVSPQQQAADIAKKSTEAAIEAKKAQKARREERFEQYRQKAETAVSNRLKALANTEGINGKHK